MATGLDVVRRALARGLSRLGKSSTLDGLPCGPVHLAYGVDLFAGMLDNANDNHVVRADVATIASTYEPRTGQTLVHPDGTFKLTRLLKANGYNVRYIVVKAP